jgi:DNA repair protein RecO (recombination protein O)
LKGIVIREHTAGDNKKFISILTENNGIIEVSVKGSSKINSKSSSSTQLFAYSMFCINKRNDMYYLNSSEPIEIFYNLRTDLKKISLASYFSEIVLFSVGNEEQDNYILKLFLNTLHFIANEARDISLLKCIFELRFMTETGLMPDVVMCRECGKYTAPTMYFLIKKGRIICEDCYEGSDGIKISSAVLSALRHIIFSDFDRLFNFKVSEHALNILSYISENYLLIHLDKKFKTLDFYKSVSDI